MDPTTLEEIINDYYRKHCTPLRAIRNLSAALSGNPKMSTITLKWADPSVTVSGKPGKTESVDIFQAPDETTPIGTVAGGVQTFTTKDLAPGVYSFSAIAIDAAGVRSAPSNIATATVVAVADPLAAISDLSATVNP
jgi:hypothetical protein